MVIKLHCQMHLEGVVPDQMVYVNILKVCAQMQALDLGKRLHAIVAIDFEVDAFIETGLVDMYAKCGCINEAQKVFDRMAEQDIVAWGVLMSGCCQLIDALSAFSCMQLCSVMPDSITYVGVLKTCANLSALKQGKYIHACIINSGFEHDAFVRSTLMDMYAKCACMDIAHLMFSELPKDDVVCWNVMISGYANHGYADMALQLFWQMQGKSVIPNDITFASVLPACSVKGSLKQGKLVHASIPHSVFESRLWVGSTLIEMYVKCGSLPEAEKVFSILPHQDVILWNGMISACIEESHHEEAFKLFVSMHKEGFQPDQVTSLLFLKVCANLGRVEEGRKAHSQVVESGFDFDVSIGNILVDLYARHGKLDDAKQVLDSMCGRNVVSWNSLILGYVQDGQGERAFELFQELEEEDVKPNEVTYMGMLKACTQSEVLQIIHAHAVASSYEWSTIVSSTLVDMYSKCGSLENAQQVFEQLLERSVVASTTMIAGYARYGFHEEARTLLLQMQLEGMNPDMITFVNILNSCASMVLLEEGKQIHAYILESEYAIDAPIGNTLINMYFKCGRTEDAIQAFDRMPVRDAVSWSVLLEGYALHGQALIVLELVDQMQKWGLELDHIVLIGVLTAFSHAGLVDEGCTLFGYMLRGHGRGPTLEHYTCIVDLLGRAGLLEKAEELIEHMAIEPDVKVWSALLGACQTHCNMEMAKRVIEHVLKLEPDSTSVFIILSNLSAAMASVCGSSRECPLALFA